MITTPSSDRHKADDYLRTLSKQNDEIWFTQLVDEIIRIHKVPSKAFLDKSYIVFKTANGLEEGRTGDLSSEGKEQADQGTLIVDRPIDSFTLRNLTHENGVNALKRGATIPFHPKLTVIYGKNAAGKSGFVRILKRLGNSRTQEDIWQNVHNTKSKNNCSASVAFENNGTESIYKWNGEKNIEPFRQMSIFDGKSIPIRLTESLELSYQPYGFELFQILSSSLQTLQERLSTDVRIVQAEKPNIDGLFDEDTKIGQFVSHISSSSTIKDLDKLPKWNQKSQEALTRAEQKKKGFQNIDLQEEIFNKRRKAIKGLRAKLVEIQTECSNESISSCLGLIKKIITLKKKRSTQKEQSLEQYKIPKMESSEWENFLEAGEDYISISQHEHYPKEGDKCVYCQQKLTMTAVKLIGLYRALFQEEVSSDYESAESDVETRLNDLKDTSFVKSFRYQQDDFEKILKKKTIVASFRVMERADALIQKMINCLETNKKKQLRSINVSSLITAADRAQDKISKDITALQRAQTDLNRKIRKIDKDIIELRNVQKLSKFRSQIEKRIKLEGWVVKANQLLSSDLNTKPVTDLAKKAWKELISDSFKKQFEKEAENLDAPQVSLAFHGEYGSQMRDKSLEGLDHVERFLSEGEQKAVALADFFAELWVQDKKIPVIFDDPATSFDHERKELIAKRIVKESESKQVIVFTHDLMFANFIHEQVEDNKGNLDGTKATFHNVEKNGLIIGEVNVNDYPGARNFNYQVQKIEESIPRLNGLSGEEKREAIANAYSKLRSAVEKAVEEKIFGRVVTRWTDQIQMSRVPQATLNKKKLEDAKKLHEEFSRYIEAHNQSNEMIQTSMPDIDRLKADIKRVRELALLEKDSGS